MLKKTDESIEAICNSYLDAWARKDVEAIAAHLHPDVTFRAPMQQLHGRDAVIAATKRMMPMLKTLANRAQFVAGDRAMFSYDFVCLEPVGVCRTAEQVRIEDDLIREIELFFDPRPFVEAQRRAAAS